MKVLILLAGMMFAMSGHAMVEKLFASSEYQTILKKEQGYAFESVVSSIKKRRCPCHEFLLTLRERANINNKKFFLVEVTVFPAAKVDAVEVSATDAQDFE